MVGVRVMGWFGDDPKPKAKVRKKTGSSKATGRKTAKKKPRSAPKVSTGVKRTISKRSSQKIKVYSPAKSQSGKSQTRRLGNTGRKRTSGRSSVQMVDVDFFPFGLFKSEKPKRARKRSTPNKNKIYGDGWGPRGRPLFSAFSFLYWGSVAVLWASIALGGLLLFYTATLPDPLVAGLKQRGQAIKVLASDGSVIAERGLVKDYVRLEQLPKFVSQAVIAIEDRRFYSHLGFDPIGFSRAMISNLRKGRLIQGGSTISQQLAKNLFLSSDRTITRKLQEMGMSFWLEAKFEKQEILELYINRVYFGHKTFGIDQAARRYFGKRAVKLTLPEAAMLAGLLKAPSRLNPKSNYKAAQARAKLVLLAMKRSGFISSMTLKTALIAPAQLRKRHLPINSNYIVDWIADLVPEYVTDYNSDLIIETSIDRAVQMKADARVGYYLSKLGRKKNVRQASLVMMAPDGAVRAMVGGRNYQQSQYNRAIKSRRQTGSAFKPFVYLAALESGFNSNSLIFDRPTTFNKWQPRNYKNIYRGQIKLSTALAHSSNVVAVKLMGTVGVVKTIETARRLGLRGEMKKDLSLALGTAEQSVLELTSAYVPFANGGRGVFPYVIKSIRTFSGRVLYKHKKANMGQVVRATHVNQMNKMMRQVLKVGTGRTAKLNGHDIAGKTGTTQRFKDGWFVGYSGHYITGVWVGNDNGASMKKVTGGGLPAKIWSDVMSFAHKGLQRRSLLATSSAPVALNGWKEVGMTRRIKPQFFEKVLQ